MRILIADDSSQKIGVIKNFLMCYGDADYKLKSEEVTTVADFLAFINTPETQIDMLCSKIRMAKNKKRTQRNLSPLINYLVIENEVNSLYGTQLEEDLFKKWFPIAKEWHPIKNNGIKAEDITLFSSKKAWWICGRGHEWKATVYNRN